MSIFSRILLPSLPPASPLLLLSCLPLFHSPFIRFPSPTLPFSSLLFSSFSLLLPLFSSFCFFLRLLSFFLSSSLPLCVGLEFSVTSLRFARHFTVFSRYCTVFRRFKACPGVAGYHRSFVDRKLALGGRRQLSTFTMCTRVSRLI